MWNFVYINFTKDEKEQIDENHITNLKRQKKPKKQHKIVFKGKVNSLKQN